NAPVEMVVLGVYIIRGDNVYLAHTLQPTHSQRHSQHGVQCSRVERDAATALEPFAGYSAVRNMRKCLLRSPSGHRSVYDVGVTSRLPSKEQMPESVSVALR